MTFDLKFTGELYYTTGMYNHKDVKCLLYVYVLKEPIVKHFYIVFYNFCASSACCTP